jgi:hypothetical protein
MSLVSTHDEVLDEVLEGTGTSRAVTRDRTMQYGHGYSRSRKEHRSN